MSTFEHKNSLRTIEAQIVQKLKNNEARPKCTGSYKKKMHVVCLYAHSVKIIIRPPPNINPCISTWIKVFGTCLAYTNF